MACYDIWTITTMLEAMRHWDYGKLMFIFNDSCDTPTFFNETHSVSLVF